MINPCYHCGRRYIGCHAECGDYKALAEVNAAERDARNADNQAINDPTHAHAKMVERKYRYKQRGGK